MDGLVLYGCNAGMLLGLSPAKAGDSACGFVSVYMLVYRFGAEFVPYPGAVTGLAIVVALIAAGLSFHLYLAGVCAALVIAGISVARMWSVNDWIALPAGIVAGCVLGVLAVRMNRLIVIIITGLAGGFVSAKYGALLLARFVSFTMPSQAVLLAVGVVLAVAGIGVQFRTSPRGMHE